MAEKIIRRIDAIAQGLSKYFTGKKCRKGHIALRHVSNGDCTVCRAEKNKAKKWWQTERGRQTQQKRESLPENRKKKRLYWAKNAEVFSERNRARYLEMSTEERRARRSPYTEEESKKAVARAKHWAQENPEKAANFYRVNAHKRRAYKRRNGGSHTVEEIAVLLIEQNHRCIYCPADLRETKMHLDHKTPLSRGGSNDITNLQWLCSGCNQRKHNKTHEEFTGLP